MTTIQWTDETWNPVTGCSRVSEGCRHCYIERTPPFRMAGRTLGDPVQLHPDRLDAPLHWKKPRRVFVNSLSDLFHEDVPDEFIDRVFATMAMTRRHTYQVLTKRPLRLLKYMQSRYPKDGQWLSWFIFDHINSHGDGSRGWPLRNVWLGVSVEDQKTADERIPILLQVPAAVRWVSAEPLLGPVDLRNINPWDDFHTDALDTPDPSYRLNWVVVGGESGPKARPCNVAWIRSIVRQCKAAAVPCFVKQLGSYVVDRNDAGFCGDGDDWPMDTDIDDPSNDWSYQGAGIRIRLHDRKGGDTNEWPIGLAVRKYPR